MCEWSIHCMADFHVYLRWLSCVFKLSTFVCKLLWRRTFMCIKIIPLFVFFHCIPSLKIDHFLVLFQKKVQICFSRIHSHLDFNFIFETYWKPNPPPPKWPNISVVYILSIFNYRQHANSVGTLSGHGSWILSVDFCPDNTHFVSRCVLGRLY